MSYDHMHVRRNGVIYTTAKELLSDPEVRASIKRTCKVAKRVRERHKKQRRRRKQ